MSFFADEATSISPNGTNSTDDGVPSDILTLMKIDQYLNYFTVIVIMIGMGGVTDIPGIKTSIRRPWGIIICALTQFAVMPLIAFGLGLVSNMQPAYAIGLLIQCSSPGGSISNMLSYFADGNISLSVCLTSVCTLLAVGFMPLNLYLYGRTWTDSADITIPYVNVIISLVFIVVPAAFGLLLKYKIPKYIERISKICSVVGTITILTGVGLRAYIEPGIFLNSWEIWVLVACLPIIGTTVGFVASSMICQPCSNRRTICLETGCQNVALALNVINTSFPPTYQRTLMQIIPSLYGPIMSVELLVIIISFRLLRRFGHCTRCDDGKAVHDDDVEEFEFSVVNSEMKMANENFSKTTQTQPEEFNGHIDATEKGHTNYSFE